MASIVTVPEAASARSACRNSARALAKSSRTSSCGAKRLRIASNCSFPPAVAEAVAKRAPGRRRASQAAARAIGGPMRPTSELREPGSSAISRSPSRTGAGRLVSRCACLFIRHRVAHELLHERPDCSEAAGSNGSRHNTRSQQRRMRRARPARQAHTEGHTYCTVRAPCRFMRAARPRLSSGESHAHENVRAKLAEPPQQPAAQTPTGAAGGPRSRPGPLPRTPNCRASLRSPPRAWRDRPHRPLPRPPGRRAATVSARHPTGRRTIRRQPPLSAVGGRSTQQAASGFGEKLRHPLQLGLL